ncbi:hypothetical protein [Aquimarina sp. 2201CG5-10]|uniref:hypothetical protein n=1 Tax=Aquimarina callyspongiae TaxID=3098150 RepID=UPI002AB462A4|nr:hypothetical protein [Aquimarina sp. 2201CG5-10]MDY8135127.1 hypothetical protein [Aquimarina sp. 2201CG5-10]
MKSNKHIIASIFLAVFCLMQLAELHVFGHDDADTNCAMCLLTLDQADDDHFIITSGSDVPQPILVPADIVRTIYVNSYFASSIDYSLFNKAPPSI